MPKHVLFAAVAAMLFAAPVRAIKINDQALAANGGSMANIQGTAPAAFDALRTASMAPQFDAVGRIGNCTGTWLGIEGNYAWVLTAARCVANTNLVQAAEHLTFTNRNGVALAGGAGSTSYIHPKRINRPTSVRDAGTDIALVRMKRLPASDTDAPVAPVLYDAKAEAGAPVAFVAYGSVFVNNTNLNAVWPTEGERRAWGQSKIDGVTENGHALFANFTIGSTTNWAGMTTSDAGSAWWQQRNGQWQIVATTSSGSAVQSHGARVSTYATWIKDLFPNVRLSSDTRVPEAGSSPEITESQGYVSPVQGDVIAYVKSAGQPGVVAPTGTYAQVAESGATIMQVPVTNAVTGEKRLIHLRATRVQPNCGYTMPMNNRVGCSGGNRLEARFVQAENAFLLGSIWRGHVSIDAVNGGGLILAQLPIDIELAIPSKPISATQGLDSGNFFGANIAFTIPTQASATGPTSMNSTHATTGMTTFTVNARDAVTQGVVPVKLRAQRSNGCADLAMNNAVNCAGFATSKLRVWFDPSDNVSLPSSRYRAQFNIQARGWHDKTFNKTYSVDLDINLMP